MKSVRPDHRPIVAAHRREKMHGRLVEAALLVIAEKGIETTVIDDVIATAGVSRGTFYNHFTDVHELMLSARDALVDEWLDLALTAVAKVEDPAQSCAIALRAGLEVADDYPLLARFHIMIGTNFLRRGNLVSVLLPPLVQRGIDMGRFRVAAVDLLVDCMAAVVVVALQRTAMGQAYDMAEIIAVVLRMLNVNPAEIPALADLSAPRVTPPSDGLIARSDAALRRKLTGVPAPI